MTQTAVEWLENQYTQSKNTFQPHVLNRMMIKIFEKAKRMEKDQILNAFADGQHQQGFESEAEQYYKETYGK